MAGIPLSRALDGSFLEQLKRAQASSDPTRTFLNKSSDSSSVSIGPGLLRTGAKLFSNAVQNLNGVIFRLNETEDILSKVGDITDDLIDLTTRASKFGVSKQTESRLTNKFRELATDFRNLVENSSGQNAASLNRGDLEAIFTTVGLDEEASSAIASVFEQFISAEGTNTLASEETKAVIQSLPSTAFGISTTEVQFTEVTAQANITSLTDKGFVSDVGHIYEGTDDFSGYNTPGSDSVIVETDGATLGGLTPILRDNATVLAVNDATGESLITSTTDFLGYNSDQVEQLFLVDSSGNVTAQVTSFAAGDDADIKTADLSSGASLNIVYTYELSASGTDEVDLAQGVEPFTDPATFSVTNFASLSTGAEVKINEEGTFLAYYDVDTATITVADATNPLSTNTTNSDATSEFGFNQEEQITYVSNTATPEAITYDNSTSSKYNAVTLADYQAGSFTVLQDRISNDADFGAAAYFKNDGSISVLSAEDAAKLSEVANFDSGYGYAFELSLARPPDGVTGLLPGGVLVGALLGDASDSLTNNFSLFQANGADVSAFDSLTYQLASTKLTSSAITSYGQVFSGDDSSQLLRYNSAQQSLFTYSFKGVTTAVYDTISTGLNVLAINDETGFFVAESSDDLLGYNPSKYNQLFLFDYLGRAVQQITNDATGIATFSSVSIKGDNGGIAYTSNNSGLGSNLVYTRIATYGSDPAALSNSTLDSEILGSGTTIDEVKISNDGTHIAYKVSGTNDEIRFGELIAFSADSYLTSQDGTFSDFEFIDNDTLALVREDGLTDDIVSYQYGSSSEIELVANVNNVGQFTAAQGQIPGRFKIFYEDVDIQTVNLYESAYGVTYTEKYDRTQSETIGNISVTGRAKIGISGALPSLTDSGLGSSEFYTIAVNSGTVNTTLEAVSAKTVKYESVLNPPSLSRRNALQLKNDLKALREQIDQNLDTIGEAKKTVGEYLEFFRQAGKSFLKISDQISDASNAEETADKLVTDILRNSDAARRGAADALQSVTVATLLLDDGFA